MSCLCSPLVSWLFVRSRVLLLLCLMSSWEIGRMRDREMVRESGAKRDITRERLRRQRGVKTDMPAQWSRPPVSVHTLPRRPVSVVTPTGVSSHAAAPTGVSGHAHRCQFPRCRADRCQWPVPTLVRFSSLWFSWLLLRLGAPCLHTDKEWIKRATYKRLG